MKLHWIFPFLIALMVIAVFGIDPSSAALSKLKVAVTRIGRIGSGKIIYADLNFDNLNAMAIVNPVVECSHFTEQHDFVGKNTRIVYDNIPALSSKWMCLIDMGRMAATPDRSECRVIAFS